jgi:hypothetical protein
MLAVSQAGRRKCVILPGPLASVMQYRTWAHSDVRDLYPAGALEAPTSRCHVFSYLSYIPL